MPAPDAVTGSARPQVSRKCAACEEDEEELQRKETGTAEVGVSETPASVYQVLQSPGQPLDESTRAYFEPRFGHDFGAVRLHSDTAANQSAREMKAQAYTVGQKIVFGTGRLAPGTQTGRRLLAHELAHVVQQRSVPMIQRQPLPPDTGTSVGCQPWPDKPVMRGESGHKPAGRDITIEHGLAITPGHFCETPPKSVGLLQYRRKVWIRTVSGHEAILVIEADTSFFAPFDSKKSDSQQLRTPGYSSFRWHVDIKYSKANLKNQGIDIAEGLTDWHTPPRGNGRDIGHSQSISELAKLHDPMFDHFFLSPTQQQQALEDFVEQSAIAEIAGLRRLEDEIKKQEGKKARQNKDDEDPWYAGLLRALGTVAKGFATVLLLGTAIFLAAGVFMAGALTFTAALVIAGAILFIYGFVSALHDRAGQSAYKGRPGAGIFRSFLDTIGATGIEEAWTGEDAATGRKLTPGERVERGTVGGVAVLALLFGGRSALKKVFGRSVPEPPVTAPRASPTEPPRAAPPTPQVEPPKAAPSSPQVEPPVRGPERPYVNNNPKATGSEIETGRMLDSKAQAGILKGISRVEGEAESKIPGNRSGDYRFVKPDGTKISADLFEPRTRNTASIVSNIILKSSQAKVAVVRLGEGTSGQLSIEQANTIANDVLRTPDHNIGRVIVVKDGTIVVDSPP